MKLFTTLWFLLLCIHLHAQNVGIGLNAPQAPLHIKANVGEALRLQSSDPFIGFYDNGGNYGAYIWLNKLFGNDLRLGTPAGSNIAIAFSPNQNTSLYIAHNGNVGLGNIQPNAPLAFTPTLGKKITLYPGASGDAGFGVAGNRLQIYSDNPNADVAIGYDAAGVFNERFAVKPNGALAVNGNTGSAGQVLRSNGPGAAASWVTLAGGTSISTAGMPPAFYAVPNNQKNNIPGATFSISLSAPAKVFLWIGLRTQFTCLLTAITGDYCNASWKLYALRNGSQIADYEIKTVAYTPDPNTEKHDLTYGPIVLDLPGGIHNFSFQEELFSPVSGFGITISANALILPQ